MMKKIKLLFVMTLLGHSFITNAQFTITNDSIFDTAKQMFLANEMFESGEPYAEALGYNLDDLDPMVPNVPDSLAYTTGIENYEYSRYLLNTVNGRSGIGLHMMWSPVVTAQAAMQPASFDGQFTGGTANGFKEDDMLMMMIGKFGMHAHFVPFEHPFPIYAAFKSGDNRLPQNVTADFLHNFASTRWDRSKMEPILHLGGMAQTMLKQYYWAQDMLGAFHDMNDNEIVPDGTNSPDFPNSPDFDPNNNIFYGGNNIDGFIGQVLTAEAINMTKFTISSLAFDGNSLGGVDPATYDPANGIKYFPTGIRVTESIVLAGLPPKLNSMLVTSPKSLLFDQLSFLLATSSFRDMMNPNNNSDPAHLAYHEVFDGSPFPADMATTGTPGPYDLMSGAAKVTFLNMMAMHFHAATGSFVDEAKINNSGQLIQFSTISAENTGYALVALKKFKESFAGTPLETMANNAIISQADFIINNMIDASNGGFYNNFYPNSGGASTLEPKRMTANTSLIRGLYAAYQVTGNTNYLNAANNAYQFLISHFYMPGLKVFYTIEGVSTAHYTPYELAFLSVALREAKLVGNQTDAPVIYNRVFTNIYNKMLLSEAEATGETGGDSDNDGIPYIVGDNRPFVFVGEATYDLSTSAISGIEADKIKIYPNPSHDIININSDITFYNYSIQSLSGQLILKNELLNSQIDISHLHKGVYILILKNETDSVIKKIIKK